jgi:hypothetical protein
MKIWTLNVLIAFDSFWNVVFKGEIGGTISGRAHTARRDGRVWGCYLCKVLDWLQRDHCLGAYLNDIKRIGRE